MMPRGEFLKAYLQRRRNTIQKVDRVRTAEANYQQSAVSQIDEALERYKHAQNDLEEALMQESDFIYDRFAELEGSLVLPSRLALGSEPRVSSDNAPSEREPKAINSEPRI